MRVLKSARYSDICHRLTAPVKYSNQAARIPCTLFESRSIYKDGVRGRPKAKGRKDRDCLPAEEGIPEQR